MASLGFVQELHRWRVRWRATNRHATQNRIFAGSRVFENKAEAVGFFASVEEQERLWRKGHVPGKKISDVLDDYFRFAQRLTERTQYHYKFVLNSFVSGLPDNVIWIQQLKPEHIRAYLTGLLDKGCKNRTCNAHLTAIKSFCRYVHENFDLNNPAGKIKMFTEDPPDARFLTPDEFDRIMAAAPELARDRLMFLANTGLRADEFSRLTPDCLNEDCTALTITGKGRKQRTIPLNEIAREILPRIAPATPNSLWLQCNRIAVKIGIPRFGPHAFRHWFATRLLLAGVPIIKVSKIMGHASVTTTQERYAHILTEDLQGITDVLCKKPEPQQAPGEEPETKEPIRFPRIYRDDDSVTSNVAGA
jgi:site-specific recombinase XerD